MLKITITEAEAVNLRIAVETRINRVIDEEGLVAYETAAEDSHADHLKRLHRVLLAATHGEEMAGVERV